MLTGCGVVQSATKSGMKPILRNSIEAFVTEPDPLVAEGAILGNLKLIEGVVGTYPDDPEFLALAAMARANFAFGFLVDELEALRLAHPERTGEADQLVNRIRLAYRQGRAYAERALAQHAPYRETLGGRDPDSVHPDAFRAAVATLGRDQAPAAFWLAFNWGGMMQAGMDVAEVTDLPKVEALVQRVLELDERLYYDVGPNLLAGVLYGFRAPALGGHPAAAVRHLDRAEELGGILLPRVLKAQFVFGQTEQKEAFVRTLTNVLETPVRPERALLDTLAQIKACRLLAYLDTLFLSDAPPVPRPCHRLPHKYPLPEPGSPAQSESAPSSGRCAPRAGRPSGSNHLPGSDRPPGSNHLPGSNRRESSRGRPEARVANPVERPS